MDAQTPLPEESALYGTPSPHGRLADAAFSLLLVGGYASVLIAFFFFGATLFSPKFYLQIGGFAVGIGALIVVIRLYLSIRRRGRRPYMAIANEILVFVILPVWGLLYNHEAPSTCSISSCAKESTAMRPLAEPEVFVLFGLHALVVLAYTISRRRKEALTPLAEILVHSFLMIGITMQLVLGAHFGVWLLAGIAFPPAFLPCLSPVLAATFFFIELRGRLRLRGVEARAKGFGRGNESVYRDGPPQAVPLGDVDMPTLRRALMAYPALLGVYALFHGLWLGEVGAFAQVFTRTCDYTFSQVPLEIIPADCHYLCTVAARGHRSLVRPLRLGKRAGVTIIVNRQLAVANAFEDLLHERFPRFGRLARRTYDRLARPICQHLRSPWISDLVYLAMKPLEWSFYLTLLLLDRQKPEERIARMYRPS